eukprot:scaffold221_cov351-Pavlova_lutheri.AAC.29
MTQPNQDRRPSLETGEHSRAGSPETGGGRTYPCPPRRNRPNTRAGRMAGSETKEKGGGVGVETKNRDPRPSNNKDQANVPPCDALPTKIDHEHKSIVPWTRCGSKHGTRERTRMGGCPGDQGSSKNASPRPGKTKRWIGRNGHG